MLRHIEDQPWLALDTESDSLFRYTPRVCLIQVTVPAAAGSSLEEAGSVEVVDYLLDPLKLRTLSKLGEVLGNAGTEVILHAAENDMLTMERDFKFAVRRLFDTQLAARILGRQGVGLAQVLQEEFAVASDKRMQRTDWGQRPLTREQMTYAQIDTHYLPALRARQYAQLQAAGRWEEAQDAFRMLEKVQYRPPVERSFWQMKQTRTVAKEDLGVLQAVWEWRERQSKRVDRPPFKVLGESVLVALAKSRPQSTAALRRIRGVSVRQVERFGVEMLEAVRRGSRLPAPERPASPRRSEPRLGAAARNSFETLRRWRSATAEARGVDPDIVFSNDTLYQIVAGRPTTVAALQELPAVGRWKAQTYGPAILELLSSSQ